MALIAMTACNKDDNDINNTASMYVPAVAVTRFYLKADSKVMNNLDSVFFSIDLENGVIFNADSLPKGTKISTLIPMITYSSTVTDASIEMEGGSYRTGTTDYRKNPGDSIDFTGKVTLTLKSEDVSRSYLLKVNVHKTDADSLTWGETAFSDLPSRMASPRRQKTLAAGDKTYSLIEESDGTFTFASCTDLFRYQWDKKAVTLPAGSDVRNLEYAGGCLYILDGNGALMKADPSDMQWSATGEIWTSIDGEYAGHILGIGLKDGVMTHLHYPAASNIAVTPVEECFPVKEHSAMQAISNSWSAQPTVFIFGGVTSDGTVTDAVWAFDGENWANINNGIVPALAGASVVPYYSYRQTSTSWIQNEYEVWLLFGGRQANGELNRTLYVSYDNGVNWKKADTSLQLPDIIPGMQQADCLVSSIAMQSNLSDAWTVLKAPKRVMTRLPYEIDGYEISWKCPYLFIFGGENKAGSLDSRVWRGVLERMRFTPLI